MCGGIENQTQQEYTLAKSRLIQDSGACEGLLIQSKGSVRAPCFPYNIEEQTVPGRSFGKCEVARTTYHLKYSILLHFGSKSGQLWVASSPI